jgi:succinate dehydrogenase / fumarate reductase, cytochrome b subunit
VLALYRSDLGKKYAMAVTGLILMLFVLGHMVGNLKLYLGASSFDRYGEWLRTVGEPALPKQTLLWIVRIVLLASVFLHIDAAYRLTRSNRAARPVRYQSPREFAAADFASRTMRWSGILVALFVIFHLLDLTWGTANPDFIAGDPFHNEVASFQRVPVAIAYVIANLALALHLYHGAWSLWQSLGYTGDWRRRFSIGFAILIAVGNVSFPVAIVTRIVS